MMPSFVPKRVSLTGFTLPSRERTSSVALGKIQVCRFHLSGTCCFTSKSTTIHSESTAGTASGHDSDHNRSTATPKRFKIPEPTWSVSSLQLHESHAPTSMDELNTMAKRSVLDLRHLTDETKQQLCQDLGNMLHMMKQVQNFQVTSDDGELNDPVTLYDTPRGVSEAPFRMDDGKLTTSTKNNTNATDLEEYNISQSVRESYLEPKMTRVGGHQY
jgi:Asp-tRNA(Asn)/Glu-tRNA(Gln) amidotransferase C subunit